MIMGCDANHIKQLKEIGDEASVTETFRDAHNKEYNIKIMSKMDVYNGASKIKHQVTKISNVDFKGDSQRVLDMLDKYLSDDSIKAEDN
mmetsp:Transcript_36846/g.33083  ORF Transcript_36846/g.33083 Transcript_36846/m.33083 type:complete len:89 (-) Transcript_36846:25-291(-)